MWGRVGVEVGDGEVGEVGEVGGGCSGASVTEYYENSDENVTGCGREWGGGGGVI